MKKHDLSLLACVLALTCSLVLGICGCAPQNTTAPASEQATAQSDQAPADAAETSEPASAEEPQTASIFDPGDDYTLNQVVILSRHNIRAPLSTTGSALDIATPHQWTDWTSNASELTLRGGDLETMMGQFFRKRFEAEGLIPENWQPAEGQVRFYANAKQRTIATAQYFSSGFMPVANARIETHAEYDTMDPVFSPVITFLNPEYEQAALEQIASMGGKDGMAGIGAGLADNYELLADVLDYTESQGYQSGELKDFATDDTGVTLEAGKEPAMTGTLKTACSLADALVLQYYEADDDTQADFGHELTIDQWKQISEIKDYYGDVLFTTPLVATNVAHPLLETIGSELDTEGRVFSFLCGHDSNIASVLAALKVEPYVLPGAIERSTPIGSKLVFERWTNKAGEQFGRVLLAYQTVEQLKGLTLLQNGTYPGAVVLSFEGVAADEHGMSPYDALRAHIQDAADAYDQLQETYAEEELAEAA